MRLEAPVEADIEIVVEVFKVLEAELLANDHLVDAADEVALKQAALEKRFAEDAADELEVADVLALDVGLGVRHVGRAVVGLLEERVVLVEHLL